MILDPFHGWLAPADDDDPYRRRILGRSVLTWLLLPAPDLDDFEDHDDDFDDFDDDCDSDTDTRSREDSR